MTNSRFYSSIAAVTTLQVTAAPTDLSIQVASSVGWPNTFPFILALDYGAANEELVLVTSGGPTVFTITRAYDNTSATTHNAGATVRHVSAAIDFTDSRTHEASTTNVHGISGAFVDTNSTQTLSNKTLNNPTINSATLTGTVTATGATINNGTISGATISGGTFSGSIAGTPTHTGVTTYSAGLVTEGVTTQKPSAGNIAFTSKLDGDTTGRLNVTSDGIIQFGPGGSTAIDTTLSRSGVNALTASGTLAAGAISSSAGITATGVLTGSDLSLTGQVWTAFTPSWINTDAGMATNVGFYTKYGKVVHYVVYTVFNTSGTTSGGLSLNLPTVPYRATSPLVRQIAGQVWFEGSAAGGATNFPDGSLGWCPVFAGDTGTKTGTIRNYKGDLYQVGYIGGPSPATTLTVEGWYREA